MSTPKIFPLFFNRTCKFLKLTRPFSSALPEASVLKENTDHAFNSSSKNYDMDAWVVKTFGGFDQLELIKVKSPAINRPKDVLIEVKAASVNPLDIFMLGGYGNVILGGMRKFCNITEEESNDPLILGRDFSGIVIGKGNGVRKDLKIGDNVYGVLPPQSQGSHAQIVKADSDLVTHMPSDLDFDNAAGILYTSLTAWSALQITGDFYITTGKKKKVLVIGASGGVGQMTVQLLKLWEAEVVGTCSTEAVPLVQSLGPDLVVDYTKKEAFREISLAGKYDVIFDASGSANPTTYVPFLKDWNNSKFITLRSPMLKNTDSHGLFWGMARNLFDIMSINLNTGATIKGSTVRWGFFMPIPAGVTEISKVVAAHKLKPIVQERFSFKDLPSAYKRVSEGHLRGKIIVSMSQRDSMK